MKSGKIFVVVKLGRTVSHNSHLYTARKIGGQIERRIMSTKEKRMTVQEKAIAFLEKRNWDIIEKRAFEVVVKQPSKSYLIIYTYCSLASRYDANKN